LLAPFKVSPVHQSH